MFYFCTFVEKNEEMTTVIIDNRSIEAKKMLEFLRATRYAKIVEDDIPNSETLEAIEEVESGKVNTYNSAQEMMKALKKKAGV